MYTAEMTGTGLGWSVYDPDWEGEYAAEGLNRDQALMGALVMNAGGLGDVDEWSHYEIRQELEHQLGYVTCVRCNNSRMRITIKDDRCGCRS